MRRRAQVVGFCVALALHEAHQKADAPSVYFMKNFGNMDGLQAQTNSVDGLSNSISHRFETLVGMGLDITLEVVYMKVCKPKPET